MSKRPKSRPVREAAKRASNAVHSEAEHVEDFSPVPSAPTKRAPAKKKKNASARKAPSGGKTPTRASKPSGPFFKNLVRKTGSALLPGAPAAEEEEPARDDEKDEGGARPVSPSSNKPRDASGASGRAPSEPTSGSPDSAHGSDPDYPPSDLDDVPEPDDESSPGAAKEVAPVRESGGGGAPTEKGGGGAADNKSGGAKPLGISRKEPARAEDAVDSRAGEAPRTKLEYVKEQGMEATLAQLLFMAQRQEIETKEMRRELALIRDGCDDIQFRLTNVENKMEDVKVTASAAPAPAIGGKRARRIDGGIAGYEHRMGNKFPHIALYFPDSLWTHAILYASIEHIWTTTSADFTMEEGMQAISAVLLARSNNGKKDIFDTEVGRRASMFRHTVLTSALQLARCGKYPPVLPSHFEDVLDDSPFWLGKRGKEFYITDEHVTLGQNHHEKRCSNTPEYLRRVAIGDGADPIPNDYAIFIMIRLYKIMNDRLGNCRRKVREDFCQVFGYLFLKWPAHRTCRVSENGLQVRWSIPFDSFGRMPSEKVREASMDGARGVDVDSNNRAVYRHTSSACKELRLYVSHKVLLAKPGTIPGKKKSGVEILRKARQGSTPSSAQRKGKGNTRGAQKVPAVPTESRDRKGGDDGIEYEPVVFRRFISMLVPASAFLLAWAGLSVDTEPYKLLQYHNQSMRVLYNVAMLFREVFDLHPVRTIGDGRHNPAHSGRAAPDGLQGEVDKFFDMFVPANTVMERPLELATSCVDPEFYDLLHVVLKPSTEKHPARADKAGGGNRPVLTDADVEDGTPPRAGNVGRSDKTDVQAPATVRTGEDSEADGDAAPTGEKPKDGARPKSSTGDDDTVLARADDRDVGRKECRRRSSTKVLRGRKSAVAVSSPAPDEDVDLGSDDVAVDDAAADARDKAHERVASLLLDDDEEEEGRREDEEAARADRARRARAEPGKDVILPARRKRNDARRVRSDAEEKDGDGDSSEDEENE